MILSLLALAGCAPTSVTAGDYVLEADGGALTVTHTLHGPVLSDLVLRAGTGSAEVEMSLGSYRFEDVETELVEVAAWRSRGRTVEPAVLEATAADGSPLGTLVAWCDGSGRLVLDWSAHDPEANRLGLRAACDDDDHFMGLGGYAMDVDHVGQAFSLWASEPGVGKVDTEDGSRTGTRHASSLPSPFLLRPHRGQGLLTETTGRVDVDLCATDPDAFEVLAWDGPSVRWVVIAADGPVEALQARSGWVGRPPLAPPWVFGPWADAVRGPERVREVAAALRDAGSPVSALWTEDWTGGMETPAGYRLSHEWTLDTELYPNAAALDAELEAMGFRWLAYFAPFLLPGTDTWDDAVAADVLIHDANGEPYLFPSGVLGEDASMVDLSTEAGRGWARGYLQAARDAGFEGWMADYGESLPPDAVLASGEDPMVAHNAYPVWWQEVHADVLGSDGVFFARSGWTGTTALAPVVGGGDPRASFDADDGLPSVLSLGLGLAASGVGVFTHDIAGNPSVGAPPSTKELWLRWAALGAFSPVMRTHHGALEDSWPLDSDAETLAAWVRLSREHVRLHPYLYGLAARASDAGVPMILPVGFRYAAPWDRADAWLLGDALLVAPVLEEGETGRDVELPGDVAWYDYWTGAPARSGRVEVPLGEIAVFAAAGTTVPRLVEIPDTASTEAGPGVVTLADVDGAREVLLYGGGGPFTEADGTTYTPSGSPTGPGQETATLASGTVEVAGVMLAIEGPVERTYTVVVVD